MWVGLLHMRKLAPFMLVKLASDMIMGALALDFTNPNSAFSYANASSTSKTLPLSNSRARTIENIVP
jgi:hypothetical protein